MIQLEEEKERLLLVGVSEQDGDDTEGKNPHSFQPGFCLL